MAVRKLEASALTQQLIEYIALARPCPAANCYHPYGCFDISQTRQRLLTTRNFACVVVISDELQRCWSTVGEGGHLALGCYSARWTQVWR